MVLCDFVSLLSVSIFLPFLCLLSFHPLLFVNVCLSLLLSFCPPVMSAPPLTHIYTRTLASFRSLQLKGQDIIGSTCALTLRKHTFYFLIYTSSSFINTCSQCHLCLSGPLTYLHLFYQQTPKRLSSTSPPSSLWPGPNLAENSQLLGVWMDSAACWGMASKQAFPERSGS